MEKLNLSWFEKARTFEIKYLDIDGMIDKDFVKNLRNKLNMTQLVFSSVIGVTKKTVEKWEQGKNPIKGATARFLYLLDLNPELISEFYLVNSYDTEIKYDVENVKIYSEIINQVNFNTNYSCNIENEGFNIQKKHNNKNLTFSA